MPSPLRDKNLRLTRRWFAGREDARTQELTIALRLALDSIARLEHQVAEMQDDAERMAAMLGKLIEHVGREEDEGP